MRDIRQGADEVLKVYLDEDSEVRVGVVINRLYRRYGMSALCGLTSVLIRASVPKDMAEALKQEVKPIVAPILVDLDAEEGCGECDDCKNYEVMNSVSQYIAAVIAGDTDMLVAIFKANMRGGARDEWSIRFLSLAISTACNTYHDVKEDE